MKRLERGHEQDGSGSLRNFTVTLLELLTDFGGNVPNLTEEVKK